MIEMWKNALVFRKNRMPSGSTNRLNQRALGCLHTAISNAACNAFNCYVGLLENVHGTWHPIAAQLQCFCGQLFKITAQTQRCSHHVTSSTFTCDTYSLTGVDCHDVKSLRAVL